MARFILDVDGNHKEIMHEVIEALSLANRVATISCINESNDSQFHNELERNKVTHDELMRILCL